MKLPSRFIILFVLLAPMFAVAQQPEIKFIADTLVVQAEGKYESDPDLAIMAFDVSSQEKELKDAYAKASQSMRTIASVAERNGLGKDAIQTGVLTITPFYEGDRKKRARAYRVQGHVILRIQDFAKVGPIMDESVQDGIADFRSLTYELSNEEAAKQKAVADAMHRAAGRATVALEQTKQKLGPARSVSLEVRDLIGIAQIQGMQFYAGDTLEERSSGAGIFGTKTMAHLPPPPPPPPVQPEKITIKASVQCVFSIEK
ncbi:MAG TPA: SIMPL domain-containing protein [Candidatus Angelobacter sp.]|jgi:hypothetical protein|nr:SIMPL domain-containing protein [Candidatus Angelobacter sp.]